jgi:L-cysteine:1D-myo-inositol 2-amino-2-deoxy-alpha-D-glucopyranoside ligase
MAIRLALLAQHYRTEWSWTADLLERAQERLDTWRAALSVNTAPESDDVVEAIRSRVADDLDTPGALAAVDAWAAQTLNRGGSNSTSAGVLARALDAILGVRV